MGLENDISFWNGRRFNVSVFQKNPARTSVFENVAWWSRGSATLPSSNKKGRRILLPLWFGFFGITGSLTQAIIIDIEYQRIDVDSADGWLKFKKDFGMDVWKIQNQLCHEPPTSAHTGTGLHRCIDLHQAGAIRSDSHYGICIKSTETVWSDKKW